VAGIYEFDWWREATKALSDDALEQVASGIGIETGRSLLQQAVALQIMHDEAVGELGRRSRAELAKEMQGRDPNGYPKGMTEQ
jgi:hypothetical protein